MTKITEMKQILADKLKAEGCYFTKKDISIQKVNDSKYKIYIADYEHIVFTMFAEIDDYFGYTVTITNNFDDYDIFVDSKKEYDIKSALLELGYYIGTRF